MSAYTYLKGRYSREELEKIIGRAQELYSKEREGYDQEILSSTARELDIPHEYVDKAVAALKRENAISEKSAKNRRIVLTAGAMAAAVVAVIIIVSLIRSSPANRLQAIRDAYHNEVVARDEKVKAALAQVENVIERRFELIPKLTDTVREYANFEKDVIATLADARESFAGSSGLEEKTKALVRLDQAIAGYQRAAARIPELTSSTLYAKLMFEIAGSDNRISVERKRYNEAVSEYNSFVRRRPLADFIEALGFEKEKKYWEFEPKP